MVNGPQHIGLRYIHTYIHTYIHDKFLTWLWITVVISKTTSLLTAHTRASASRPSTLIHSEKTGRSRVRLIIGGYMAV